MRSPVMFVAAIALAAPALAADDYTMSIESTRIERGYIYAIVKITNNTDRAVANFVVDCVYLNKEGTAVSLSKAVLYGGTRPRESGYVEVLQKNLPGIENIECRSRAY